MKTKIFLTALFTFSFCLFPCEAQVPQGFNYQAIARDGSGNPIVGATIDVKIGILSDTTTPVIVREELFSSIKTNAFGMFTLVIGTGTYQTGSVTNFSDIDWTSKPLFIRTQVNYKSTWRTMGSAKLWSVPYSLIAKDLGGSIDKLKVTGTEPSLDSTLFEVKNKDGQTVFAVYNEGVRVYVDDGLAKGVKGGFAIGGFGTDKGTSQPYFVVDPDSIRAYIDNNPVKAVKGGFAIGGFDKNKAIGNQQFFTVSDDSVRVYIDDNLTKATTKGGFAIGSFDKSKGGNANYFNVSPDSTGRIYPSQNRILWYPLKNALLAGKVIAENKDSVGVNSFASGYQSRSKGKYSQALGYQAIARGDYSTAIGKNALANNINSFAFGDSSRAVNSESYAFGRGAIASGYRSFAFGSAGIDKDGKVTNVARALGNYSFTIGQGSRSLGLGSFAIGLADTARGDYSLAMGYETNASGRYSTAMGDLTKALGEVSTAMGIMTTAGADFSTAIGTYTKASGYGSMAIGYFVTASGPGSTAMGVSTTASGNNSTAMGMNTKAKPYASFVIGRYNDTTCIWSTNWNAADPLFIIGNGSSNTSRGNAMTVLKNGNVGIGLANPTHLLHLSGGAYCDGTGAWVSGSDKSYKKEIKELDKYGIKEIMQLQPVTFVHIQDKTNTVQLGFIAQDVIGIIPELVSGTEGNYGLAYDRISVVLVKAIKEQQQQIESTKQENQQLKSLLQSLQEKVEQIETQQKEIDELKTLVNTLVANQAGQGNK